jgi:hypothetical protein
MNIFYVYVYLDTTKKGTYVYGDYEFNYKPFYVGKGKNNRYLEHITRVNEKTVINLHKNNTIKKVIDETGEIPLIEFIGENLTEEKAYELEKSVIGVVGLGNLSNYHEGGCGGDTWSNKSVDEVELIKQKISNTKKGVTYVDMFGEEEALIIKQKISEKSKIMWKTNREYMLTKNPKGEKHGMWGKTNSFVMNEEGKEKIRQGKLGCKNPGSKKYLVTDPNGNTHDVCGLGKFCVENGLSKACMYMVAKGKTKQHKGWVCVEK